MPYREILHHGAVDGVTGSCHQLLIDEHLSLLVDCGLFQGDEAPPNRRPAADPHEVTFPTRGIRALILTHVHIDHVGRIPWLLEAGYSGPILCSEPSAQLLPLVLEDAFRLGVSRDRRRLREYLWEVQSRIVPLPYRQWFTLIDDPVRRVRIKLQRAGHILGSAYVECDLVERGTGRRRRVLFSGDLGAPYAPLLPAPKIPYRADTLVLESTYGDRRHEQRRTRGRRLQRSIEHALRNGGSVLIPAFSIGRTQELLYELESIIHRERETDGMHRTAWQQLPVVLDSPLAGRFTQAYREMSPFWDREAHRVLSQGRRPLGFEQLLTVESHDNHLRMVHHLARSGRPAVVIAGSGMCNAGRIVHYLQTMLGDPRHAVLFVGYQAEGTPGRDIQRYGPRGGYVELDGERIDIRARIRTLEGYSAHADRDGLVRFATGMRHPPDEIRLVHGERTAKRALKRAIEDRCVAQGRARPEVRLR